MYLIDIFGTKLTIANSFHPSGTQDNHSRNKNTQPEAQQEHWSAMLQHSRVEAKITTVRQASFGNHTIGTHHFTLYC